MFSPFTFLAVRRAKRLLKQRSLSLGIDVLWVGQMTTSLSDPPERAYRIVTRMDAEKDIALNALQSPFKDILKKARVPKAEIAVASLYADSQETVDRDFGGDWWAHDK